MPGDAGTNSAYDSAVAQFLAHIEAEDKAKYGEGSTGWGKLSDYACGITPDEVRVYVQVEKPERKECNSWLWPDRAISKTESRKLREEHNALVNVYAEITKE